jgi:hypothetical protein
LLFHPHWAKRSCLDCQNYIYNSDGSMTMRAGLPVVAGNDHRPPCYKCPKIPDGELPCPSKAQELNAKNRKAYDHWLEARAVGFRDYERDDWIVRRNASIFEMLHESLENVNQRETMSMMATMITAGGSRTQSIRR